MKKIKDIDIPQPHSFRWWYAQYLEQKKRADEEESNARRWRASSSVATLRVNHLKDELQVERSIRANPQAV